MISVQPALAKSLFRFDPETGSLSAVMGQPERVSAFAELERRPQRTRRPSRRTPAAGAGRRRWPRRRHRTEVADDELAGAHRTPVAAGAGRRPAGPGARCWARAQQALLRCRRRRRAPRRARRTRPLPWPTPCAGRARGVAAVGARAAADAAGARHQRRSKTTPRCARSSSRKRAKSSPMRARPLRAAGRRARERRRHDDRAARLPHAQGQRAHGRPAEFGEAAWACEQLYNARLAQEPRMDQALRLFSGEALDYLGDWVEAIAAGRDGGHDAAAVARAADALRLDGQRLPLESPLPPRPAPQPAAQPATQPPEPAAPAARPSCDVGARARSRPGGRAPRPSRRRAGRRRHSALRVPDLPSAADLDPRARRDPLPSAADLDSTERAGVDGTEAAPAQAPPSAARRRSPGLQSRPGHAGRAVGARRPGAGRRCAAAAPARSAAGGAAAGRRSRCGPARARSPDRRDGHRLCRSDVPAAVGAHAARARVDPGAGLRRGRAGSGDRPGRGADRGAAGERRLAPSSRRRAKTNRSRSSGRCASASRCSTSSSTKPTNCRAAWAPSWPSGRSSTSAIRCPKPASRWRTRWPAVRPPWAIASSRRWPARWSTR